MPGRTTQGRRVGAFLFTSITRYKHPQRQTILRIIPEKTKPTRINQIYDTALCDCEWTPYYHTSMTSHSKPRAFNMELPHHCQYYGNTKSAPSPHHTHTHTHTHTMAIKIGLPCPQPWQLIWSCHPIPMTIIMELASLWL